MGGPYYKIASYFNRTPMIEMPIKIGDAEFPNPVGMAAGWIDTPDKLDTVHRLGVGIPTIKTITYKSKDGNPYPRIIREGKSMINSLGLPNKGIEWWTKMYQKRDFPVIVSIKGDTIEEWEKLVSSAENFGNLVELNISCPNVGNGLIDLEASEKIINSIAEFTEKKFLLKLSPEFSSDQNLELVTNVKDKIVGVTAINTVPVTNKKLGNPTSKGGRSGPVIYDRLITQLTTLRKKYPTFEKLPILATGGINSNQKSWEIIEKYKSLPFALTAFLTEGPRFYYNLSKYISKKLNESQKDLKEILN